MRHCTCPDGHEAPPFDGCPACRAGVRRLNLAIIAIVVAAGAIPLLALVP